MMISCLCTTGSLPARMSDREEGVELQNPNRDNVPQNNSPRRAYAEVLQGRSSSPSGIDV